MRRRHCPECGRSWDDDEVEAEIVVAHKAGEVCERAKWEAKLEKLRAKRESITDLFQPDMRQVLDDAIAIIGGSMNGK